MNQPPANPPLMPSSPFGSDPAIAAAVQYQTDLQHLKLLSIFYYIFAGLQALGGCVSVIYIVMGAAITSGGANIPTTQPQDAQAAQAMAAAGGVMIILGGCLTVLCLAWAGLTVYAGISLQQKKRRTLCYVAAAIACLSIPIGTVLGIFTFVVLGRPSVAALFAGAPAPATRIS
jgi:hypothetical protein